MVTSLDTVVARRMYEVLAALAGPRGTTPLALARRLGLARFVARGAARQPPECGHAERWAAELHEQLLSEAAHDVSRALARAGVEHMVAKGAALVGRCYRPGERDLADIDFYVASADQSTLDALLQPLGFHPLAEADQSGPPGLRPTRAYARRGRAALDSVLLDVHWGIEPLGYIVPRTEPIPRDFWSHRENGAGPSVPAAPYHAALLVHHIAHHDLLHVRGLVDLALVWPAVCAAGGPDQFHRAVARLGVRRLALALADVLATEFHLALPASLPPAPADRRGRRLRRIVALDQWLALAVDTGAEDYAAVTPRRLRRRWLTLDRPVEALRLARDALWPPAEFLAWRWPELSPLRARLRHLARVGRKVLAAEAAA